jgi:hypothetical protein
MQQTQMQWSGEIFQLMQHGQTQDGSFFQSGIKGGAQNILLTAVVVRQDWKDGDQTIV